MFQFSLQMVGFKYFGAETMKIDDFEQKCLEKIKVE